MPDFTFKNPNSLADWLEQFGYFDGGYIDELKPLPPPADSSAESPETVSFRLLRMVGGSYDAGQSRTLSCYECVAQGVSYWACSNDDPAQYFSNPYLIDSMMVNDESSKIEISIDEDIDLECEVLEITCLPDIKVLNKPFTGQSDATLFLPDSSIPTPGQWTTWLSDVGEEASWNYAYGEPREADSLPQQEYDGWFLKLKSSTDLQEFGVMFKTLASNEYGCFIELDDWYRKPTESGYSQMWEALSKAVAMLPGLTVRSGNCLLTGPEWLKSINEGEEFLLALDFETRVANGEPNGWYPFVKDSNTGWPSRVRTPGGHVANFGMWPYVRRD